MPTVSPAASKFAHGGQELWLRSYGGDKLSSFGDNVAFVTSLEVDDNPSAQNSLQTKPFLVRQASMPCGVNKSGSPQ
jgi:hypothetical protein